MTAEEHALTVADDNAIISMIRDARRRLIVVAPAVSTAVGHVIADWWSSHGASSASVILDVDPEVYRLGYGDLAALEHLERAASDLGAVLARQDGVRIGLVVADDQTLVYSPTPRLIEVGSSSPHKPNALRLGVPPTQLERDLGQGPEGLREQVVGLDKATRAGIAEVSEDLEQNPPQRFDIARVIRVFNAVFEFVEVELKAVAVERRTISIPKHLLGVASEEVRRQYSATYRLVPPDHKLSGKKLADAKDRIVKRYLRLIPGYGRVILRKDREPFDRKMKELRKALNEFRANLAKDLDDAAQESRQRLKAELLPRLKETPPRLWDWLGQKPTPEEVEDLLDEQLEAAFERSKAGVHAMELRVVNKGVTYELLQDERFMDAVRKAIPELHDLHEEYDAARESKDGPPG